MLTLCSVCRLGTRQLLSGHFGAHHADVYLFEGRIARSGGVICEGREAAVVSRAQLRWGKMFGSKQDSLTYLLRRLHRRIDGIDNSDKHDLIRLKVLANDLQYPLGILFARQLDIKTPRVDPEECGQ